MVQKIYSETLYHGFTDHLDYANTLTNLSFIYRYVSALCIAHSCTLWGYCVTFHFDQKILQIFDLFLLVPNVFPNLFVHALPGPSTHLFYFRFHPPTHAHKRIHSLTHSLTHPFTHSLTHSLILRRRQQAGPNARGRRLRVRSVRDAVSTVPEKPTRSQVSWQACTGTNTQVVVMAVACRCGGRHVL